MIEIRSQDLNPAAAVISSSQQDLHPTAAVVLCPSIPVRALGLSPTVVLAVAEGEQSVCDLEVRKGRLERRKRQDGNTTYSGQRQAFLGIQEGV